MDINKADKIFISDLSFLWPRFPLLPLTRYVNGTLQMGVLHYKCNTTVKLDNLYLVPEDFESFAELPGIDYNSVQELLEDGWMVD